MLLCFCFWSDMFESWDRVWKPVDILFGPLLGCRALTTKYELNMDTGISPSAIQDIVRRSEQMGQTWSNMFVTPK